MADYYFGWYWGDRTEDIDACAEKVLRSLEALGRCDPAFENIYVVPQERKVPYKVDVDPAAVRSIMEAGRNREDLPPYKIIESLGFKGSFVSEDFRKRGFEWSLLFHCGVSVSGVPNSCVLSVPKSGDVRDRMLQYDTARRIIGELVEIWNPDTAVLKKRGTIVKQPDGRMTMTKVPVGWMNYFASHLGKVPENLPLTSQIEIDDRGTLLIVTPDPVTMDLPENTETNEALTLALKRAELLRF